MGSPARQKRLGLSFFFLFFDPPQGLGSLPFLYLLSGFIDLSGFDEFVKNNDKWVCASRVFVIFDEIGLSVLTNLSFLK